MGQCPMDYGTTQSNHGSTFFYFSVTPSGPPDPSAVLPDPPAGPRDPQADLANPLAGLPN